jgi:hypothetical protein
LGVGFSAFAGMIVGRGRGVIGRAFGALPILWPGPGALHQAGIGRAFGPTTSEEPLTPKHQRCLLPCAIRGPFGHKISEGSLDLSLSLASLCH